MTISGEGGGVAGGAGQRLAELRRAAEDVVVFSDLPSDVDGWGDTEAHVLWLTDRRTDGLDSRHVITRPFTTCRLLPPRLFSVVWIRCGATENADDVLSAAARLVRPSGFMLVVFEGDDVPARPERLAEDLGGFRNMSVEREAMDGVATVGCYQAPAIEAESDSECSFCFPKLLSLNVEAGLPGATAVLWGDDDFFVMPDLAPVVEGHLLIVSAKHYFSMASGSRQLIASLQRHVERVEEVLLAAYGGSVVFLEHGAMYPHDAGACIDHAHWHCFPLADPNYSIAENIRSQGFSGVATDLEHLLAARANRQSYLLVREQSKTFIFAAENAPCQFLRFQIAEATTGGQWLWKHMYLDPSNSAAFRSTLSSVINVLG